MTAGDGGVAEEDDTLAHTSMTQRLAVRYDPREAGPTSSAATSTAHLPLCALKAPRTTPLRPLNSGLACKLCRHTCEPSRTAAAEGVGDIALAECTEWSVGGLYSSRLCSCCGRCSGYLSGCWRVRVAQPRRFKLAVGSSRRFRGVLVVPCELTEGDRG